MKSGRDVWNLTIGLILAWLIFATIYDHLRLVQVRQLLMDKGTPIEMDK